MKKHGTSNALGIDFRQTIHLLQNAGKIVHHPPDFFLGESQIREVRDVPNFLLSKLQMFSSLRGFAPSRVAVNAPHPWVRNVLRVIPYAG